MLKKLSAMLLAATVAVTSVVPAFAASTAGILTDEEANVNVLADITAKVTDKGEYVQGPITVIATQRYPKFDFRADLDMSSVREAFDTLFGKYVNEDYLKSIGAIADASEIAELKSKLYVVGKMDVKVTYPGAIKVPDEFKKATGLYGFGSTSGDMSIYEETVAREEANSTLSITVDIPPVKAELLESDLDKYLTDLYLECIGNQTSKPGTYKISGSVEGYTDIVLDVDDNGEIAYGDEDPDLKIDTIQYKAVQDPTTGDADLSATVIVKVVDVGGTTGGGGGNGGGGLPSKPEPAPAPDKEEVEVTFSVNGDTVVVPGVKGDGSVTVDLEDIKMEDVEGYVADGKWYTDAGCTNAISGKQTFTEDTTLYTKHTNVTAPKALNSDDHFAYVIGYPDGTVKPENNVTREEVATIFYRLLRAEVRDTVAATENNFSDVEAERWSNKAVSTMAKGEYVKGYEDGTFKPAAPITRAEFATMLVRFAGEEMKSVGKYQFSDISGHWAEENINKAAGLMWILGYEDGTFKPDKLITRAEAMTLINRVLVRYVNDSGLHEAAVKWPDNQPESWYYHEVLEATNTHEFERQEDKINEKWSAILENWVWEEKAEMEDK